MTGHKRIRFRQHHADFVLLFGDTLEMGLRLCYNDAQQGL